MIRTPNIVIPKLKLKESKSKDKNSHRNIEVSSMNSLGNLMNILCKEYSMSRRLSPRYINHKGNINLISNQFNNIHSSSKAMDCFNYKLEHSNTNPNTNDYSIKDKLSSLLSQIKSDTLSTCNNNNNNSNNNRTKIELKKKMIKTMLEPTTAKGSMKTIHFFKNTAMNNNSNHNLNGNHNRVIMKKSTSQMMMREIKHMINKCDTIHNDYHTPNTQRYNKVSSLANYNTNPIGPSYHYF